MITLIVCFIFIPWSASATFVSVRIIVTIDKMVKIIKQKNNQANKDEPQYLSSILRHIMIMLVIFILIHMIILLIIVLILVIDKMIKVITLRN